MHRPAARPRLLALVVLLLVSSRFAHPAAAAARHPQDGPHGDLRIVLGERSLRFELGLNLAFLDEIVDAPRERQDAIDDATEWPALRSAVEHLLTERVRLEIDGVRATPEIEETTLLRPDPALLPLFPMSGMRGLLRVHTTLVYPVSGEPDEVSISWPAFARDALSAQLEGGPGSAMVLQVLFNAFGTVDVLELSEARPTATWRNDHLSPMDRMLPVPGAPTTPSAPRLPPVPTTAAVLAAVLALVAAVRRRRALAGMLAVAAMAIVAGMALRDRAPSPRTLDDATRLAVFRALHANLYTAFDYTAEPDIYDALAASVDGPLLEALYQRIYQSLIMTDHEQALGRIVAVEGLDATPVPDADGDEPSFAIDATWRVDGAVHHWGHAHTRSYAYRARFVVALRPAGWRIVGQEILEQTRIPTPGDPLDTGLPPPGTEI